MSIFKKPISILYLLFSIVLISIAFQNCSSPFESNRPDGGLGGFDVDPGDEATVNEVKSLAIFEKTLYPSLQNNCAVCHATIQEPLFAVENSLDSHRILFNKDLVNLEVPENSYLAIKIRAGHNNFPVTIAEEFTESITTWSTDLQAAISAPVGPPGGQQPNPETPVEEVPEEETSPEEEAPMEPAEPETPEVAESDTFGFVYDTIIVSKCLNCHKPRADGGLGLNDDYSNHETTANSSSVVPGDALASSLYQEVLSGKMPPGNPLSDAEITSIKNWIDGGALNN